MSGVYIGRVGLCGPLAFIPKTRDARVKGSIDTLEVWPGRSKELRRSWLHFAFRNKSRNRENAALPCYATLALRGGYARDSLRPPPIEARPWLLPKNSLRG